MNRTTLLALCLGLGGCAYDHYAANQQCAQQAGCVSSFPDSGYGPIQAQAVAPDNSAMSVPRN
ncbi:hypothetical protein [Sandarakinorhabdus sp. DWP1-3-1]|uniref:hypothetical protein n=1 Tax=Sandarakinorhabdus sp. DWP1-3-1 TaxID=2804627 RepID=UPI003CF41897